MKYPFICCLLLALALGSHLQAQTFRWAYPLGNGPAPSAAWDILADHSGATVIAGEIRGSHDFDPGPGIALETCPAIINQVFVWKLDPNAELDWYRIIPTDTHSTYYTRLGVGPQDEILFAAPVVERIDIDPGPATNIVQPDSGDGAYLLMLQPDGSTRWAGALRGTNTFQINEVAMDGSGNSILIGYMKGQVDMQPGPGTAMVTNPYPQYQHFILKLDPNGQFLWANRMAVGIELKTVDIGPGDTICLGGIGFGGTDIDWGTNTVSLPGTSQDQSTFYLQVNPNGQQGWHRFFSATVSSVPYGAAFGDQGNVFLSLSHQGDMDIDPGPGQTLVNSPSRGLDLLQLDHAGNFVWGWNLPLPTYLFPEPIWDLANGCIYITKQFSAPLDVDPGPATVTLAPLGYVDLLLLRYDLQGQFISAHQIHGDASDRCEALAMDMDHLGRVLISGHFVDTIDFDPGPNTAYLNAPMLTAFIAQYDLIPITATDPGSGPPTSFKTWPNPSDGHFKLQFPQPFSGTMRIRNALGQCIWSTEIRATETWECPIILPQGCYSVEAIGKQQTWVGKVVIGQ